MALTNLSGSYNLKNYIINGNFDFWQRVEGNTLTISQATSGGFYSADKFLSVISAGTNKAFTVARSTNVPTLIQSGFESTYSSLFTVTTGISSLAAGDIVEPFVYRMEGMDYQRIHSKTVTFGFWISASIAGTYSFSLSNGSFNRSYVTTFTVSAASTWQFVTITVTLDSAGSWSFDNTIGLQVSIAPVTGSTYQTSTLNAWQTGNFYAASTAGNFFGTSGATINIAQVSLVEGQYSLGQTGFQRAGANISEELRMCQRYYEKSNQLGTAPGANADEEGLTGAIAISGTVLEIQGRIFKVTKRTTPTYGIYSYNGTSGQISSSQGSGNASSAVVLRGGPASILDLTVSGLTTNGAYWFHWTADADM